MKKGIVSKKDAFLNNDPTSVCGTISHSGSGVIVGPIYMNHRNNG